MAEFIIRRDERIEWNKIKEDVFVKKPGDGKNHCLCGIHGVGKSTLAGEWYNEWDEWKETHENEKVYALFYGATETDTLFGIWSSIVSELKISCDEMRDKDFDEIHSFFYTSKNPTNMEVKNKVTELFALLKKRGIHVILVFDELQNVTDRDNPIEKEFFTLLQELSKRIAGKKSYYVTMLLVSRSNPELLSGVEEFGKSFPAEILYGFNTDELTRCILWFRINYRIIGNPFYLSLLYYCGRNPQFWTIMNQTFLTHTSDVLAQSKVKSEICYDTPSMFQRYENNVSQIQAGLKRLMEANKAVPGKEGSSSVYEEFCQVFLGKVIETEETTKKNLDYMRQQGFVQKETLSIYSFMKTTYGRDGIWEDWSKDRLIVENTYDYEPVSLYYVKYMESTYERDTKRMEADVDKLELEIRNVIEKAYKTVLPETWLEVLIAKNPKDTFWNGVVNRAGGETEAVELGMTPVQVQAFLNYYDLIVDREMKHNFDQFFESYWNETHTVWDERKLKEDMTLLNDYRNFFKHQNYSLANVDERKGEVPGVCKRLWEDVQNGLKKNPHFMGMIYGALPEIVPVPEGMEDEGFAPTTAEYEKVNNLLGQDDKVVFHCLEVVRSGRDKKLNGYFTYECDGTQMKFIAKISKNDTQNLSADKVAVGSEFEAKKAEINAYHVNAGNFWFQVKPATP